MTMKAETIFGLLKTAGRAVAAIAGAEPEMAMTGRALVNAAIATGFPLGAAVAAWSLHKGDALATLLAIRDNPEMRQWVIDWSAPRPRSLTRRRPSR